MFKSAVILLICVLACLGQDFDPNPRYTEFVHMVMKNPELRADFEANVQYAYSLDANYINYTPQTPFNCDTGFMKNMPEATNVHEVKPSDVKVVGALGDSLTAAIGGEAITPLGLLVEYRGMAWSIGGKDNVKAHVTVPNILKKFSPNLKGFSTKDNLFFKEYQEFNVARSGQKAEHIPAQAQTLVDLMRASKDIDFENDWKVVTIFIGGNDLCQYCYSDIHLPETWIGNIQKGLDILHANLPRTIVNLVSSLNVQDIKDMNRGLICPLLHVLECACAAYPLNQKAQDTLSWYEKSYQNLTQQLVDSGRYDSKDDFTVVVQPFFKDFLAPRTSDGKVDLSFFAPDCFHLSAKSHEMAAVGLWNNMLQPVGKKATTWRMGEDIICPSEEQPYIFTSKNSK